jgi:hypothetical protein
VDTTNNGSQDGLDPAEIAALKVLDEVLVSFPDTSEMTPREVEGIVLRLRACSISVTREMAKAQARKHATSGRLAVNEAVRLAAYREALASSTWVKAGADAEARKVRAEKLALEGIAEDLGLSQARAKSVQNAIEILTLAQKDLDAARRDVYALVELKKLDVRLSL